MSTTPDSSERNVPFLVLDLGLDVVNSVRRFDLEGDGLASEGLYEDLHGGVGGREISKRDMRRCLPYKAESSEFELHS